jgi:hypothetical protein
MFPAHTFESHVGDPSLQSAYQSGSEQISGYFAGNHADPYRRACHQSITE